MPRELPWLVNKESPSTRHVSSAPLPPSASKQRSATTRSTPLDPPNAGNENPAQRSRTGNRSPSTSPPPQPLDEELMIQGIEHDDKYRMVEDEFLSVAGHFTRHLHAAEYHRLKQRAKTQNAHAIQAISRPIVGEKTDAVKRRNYAFQKSADQRGGIAKIWRMRVQQGCPGYGQANDTDTTAQEDDNDGEDPLSCAGASLQGLMNSPRKKAEPLRILISAPNGLRRRLALGQEGAEAAGRPDPSLPRTRRESVTDSEEDDLDRGHLPGPQLNNLLSAAKPTEQFTPGNAAPATSGIADDRSMAHDEKPGSESRKQGTAMKSPCPSDSAQQASGEGSEDELLTRMQRWRDRRKRERSAKTNTETGLGSENKTRKQDQSI